MNKRQIAEYNIGKNLDDLCNLDPRGYGVCRILYEVSKRQSDEPVSIYSAKALDSRLKKGDLVYFLTGFVLLPYEKAETDGITGTLALARALALAYGIKPVVFCPTEAAGGIGAIAKVMGFRPIIGPMTTPMDSPCDICDMRDIYIEEFPKDRDLAIKRANEITNLPKVCISVEAPGANARGVYHNALGIDVTKHEAKLDILFEKLKEKGVFTLAIGDLGNEIGMAALGEDVEKYVPYTAEGTCKCGCRGGTRARTSADVVMTATVSDWGAYALSSAIAYITGKKEASCPEKLVEEALLIAGSEDLIDMYGEAIPAVDGCDLEMNVMIAGLIKKTIDYLDKHADKCEHWFESVEAKGFFK